jgi:uncharacterized protein (TIGR02453 family)
MLQSSTFLFLKNLSKHNQKEWFETHRNEYEAAKKDMQTAAHSIIQAFGKKDPQIAHLTPKDCLFRINRDVRFSKDKSPYKTNMGAYFCAGGKKSMLAGYYLHCEPGKSFVGGGVWMPEAGALKKIRQEIDYNLTAFEKIVQRASFQKTYGGLLTTGEHSLVNVPKGYEKDNPAARFLKLKSFVATSTLADADLCSKEGIKKVVQAFEHLQPLVYFLNEALSDSE